MTKKTEITKSEYYQLMGLAVLAETYTEALKAIEKSVIDITGEETIVYGGGHSGDFIYNMDVEDLLKKLDLKVEK